MSAGEQSDWIAFHLSVWLVVWDAASALCFPSQPSVNGNHHLHLWIVDLWKVGAETLDLNGNFDCL